MDEAQEPASEVMAADVLGLIEFHAQSNPHRIFCQQLEETSRRLQPFAVTYESLFHMVGKCQTWLKTHLSEQLQKESTKSPVALLLDSDIGLMVHLFACIGLGIPVRFSPPFETRLSQQVFLLSNSLSSYTLRHLLSQSKTSLLIVSLRCQEIAKRALAFLDNELLIDTRLAVDYRCLSDRSGLKVNTLDRCPVIVNMLTLHTNPLEGLPRPVTLSGRYLMTLAESASPSLCSGGSGQSLVFSTFPMQHCCGLLFPMLSLRSGQAFIAPPSSWALCSQSTLRILRQFEVHYLMIHPSILERITESPAAVRLLTQMDGVAYSWASLDNDVGEQLALKGVKLMNAYGTTELGIISTLEPSDRKDWSFFHVRHSFRFSAHAPQIQPPFQFRLSVRLPGEPRYIKLKDVFIRSEFVASRFRRMESSDIIIRLDTGALFPPLLVEEKLNEHVNIREALVFAQSSAIVVIVEATSDMTYSQRLQLKPNISSLIMQTWGSARDHRHLIKIVIVGPEMTFPRSGDGTVLRSLAYRNAHSLILDEVD